MSAMRTLLAATALAAATLATSVAQASTLFSYTGPSPEITSPGNAFAVFSAGAGAGLTSFRIDGYTTLDGVNCCTDTFTLNLNGTDILSGSWDMGGGGANVLFFAPAGSSISPHTNGFGLGGYTDISVPLSLLAGGNVLNFSYSGASQGLGDEGWGLETILVTGNSGVPEPAAWALMLAGFGMVGATLRRRAVAVGA
jgi:hypothetical protein